MPEKLIHTKSILPGMQLSKPLHANGTNKVLFPKDFLFDSESIQKAQTEGIGLVYIYSESDVKVSYEDKIKAAYAAQAKSAENKPATTKILVVDDDDALQKLIKFVVMKSGKYNVIGALNATKGWEILLTDPEVEIVFLDINMPEISGLELLQVIKKQLDRPIKVIMVTGNNVKDDVIKCFQLGAADYVVKPFTPDRLMKVLDGVSGNQKNEPPQNV